MSRNGQRWLARLVGLSVLGASFVIGGVWMQVRTFMITPLALPESGVVLDVTPGDTVAQLAARLIELGAIETAWPLRWGTRWDGRSRRIKAGEYRLTPELTPDTLLDRLVEGRTISYRVTLVEGWNFRQFRAALAADPVLTQTLPGVSDAEVMTRLSREGQHPEGRFFPDTYLFTRGTSDLDVLRRAMQRMDRILADAWQQRAPDIPIQTPYEALILASIVEKETGVASERAEIAGVFTRRLQRNMKLQTDPTVIYGIGERFDGNIRRSDLKRDTPYNTYVHRGLPPTPICMPGADAIHAAVNPADGKSLYFVSRGDGSHQFSETLEAHNRAVRKYQLKR